MWFSVSLLALLAVQSFAAPTENAKNLKIAESIVKCAIKYDADIGDIVDAMEEKSTSLESLSAAGCTMASILVSDDRKQIVCGYFEKDLEDTCNEIKDKLKECLELDDNPDDATLMTNFFKCKGVSEM